MRRLWTEEEIQVMRNMYPHYRASDIAARLNRSVESIYGQAYVLKLRKSEEFMHSEYCGRINRMRILGKDRRFKKGQTPPNKGKKWQEWMSNEGRKNSLKTTFNKGNLPHNTRSDGDVSIRREKDTGRGYKFIRLKKAVWVPLHRAVWIMVNGEIPKGKVLRCLSDDTLNCDPSNWELIDRLKHLAKNSGMDQMSDKYIALVLARFDKELRRELMERPDILDLKRTEMTLKKVIYENAG